MKKVIAVVLLAILGLTGLGCVAVSKYATPATVDQAAVKYAAEAGVIDANSYRGYANLEKAERLERALESAYKLYTLGIEQARERHELDYGILAKISAANTKRGQATEAALFSERGLIPLVAGLAGFGGLGGLIGLLRKRPGDITPVEMESALTSAGMDVQDKERQMLEIVAGVQAFLSKPEVSDEAKGGLKDSLTMAQSGDTRKVIAALKAV